MAGTDREAITELIYGYANRVDARDPDGVVACFTDDALFATRDGSLSIEGREPLLAFFGDAFRGGLMGEAGASTHLMGNVLVEVTGDDATTDVQAVVFIAAAGTGQVVVRGVNYHDRCRRTAHGWRLAERIHHLVWQGAMPGAPA